MYTSTSRKVVGKKNTKVHATRPKGGLGSHSNFAHWPKGISTSLYFCMRSFTFTVECL